MNALFKNHTLTHSNTKPYKILLTHKKMQELTVAIVQKMKR